MHKSQLVSPKKIKMHLVRKYFEHFVFPPITPALKASTNETKVSRLLYLFPPPSPVSSSVHNTLFNFVCRYDASKHELMFLSSNGIYKTLEYTESLPPYHPASLELQMDVKCQKEHIFAAEGAVVSVVFSYPYHISTAHNITSASNEGYPKVCNHGEGPY